jgi:uncharacterized membrane protein YqjE
METTNQNNRDIKTFDWGVIIIFGAFTLTALTVAIVCARWDHAVAALCSGLIVWCAVAELRGIRRKEKGEKK